MDQYYHDEVSALNLVGTHPNLVKVLDFRRDVWATDANNVSFKVAYIVQEFMPLSDVFDHVM